MVLLQHKLLFLLIAINIKIINGTSKKTLQINNVTITSGTLSNFDHSIAPGSMVTVTVTNVSLQDMKKSKTTVVVSPLLFPNYDSNLPTPA